MSYKFQILLCEDDENLGNVLRSFLEMSDYEVELCRDGKLGLKVFKTKKFDLCLLDVMMPNMDGFQLASEIREIDPEVPLFFLTAKNVKTDLIKGYKLGADDYITKPFDSEVLLFKIKAIFKKKIEQNPDESDSTMFKLGKFEFNAKLRTLTADGVSESLSPKEAALLKLLCLNKNDLLERDHALKEVWGSDAYFNSRSMDVFITKLRKYLSKDPTLEIVNIHGTGFRLVESK